MRALSLVVFLAGTSALSAEPVRLAMGQLQGVNVARETLSFYVEHLASNARTAGLTVVTAREIQTMLGLERQKQLMGCGETSCLAELAAALGADAVLVGDVGRFDSTYQLNLKVLNARDAKVIASRSARVVGEVEALDALAMMGAQLSRALLEAKERPVSAELLARTQTSGPSVRTLALIPMGVGVVVGGIGGVLFGLSRGDYAALTVPGEPLSEADAQALRRAGSERQIAGSLLMAVGATSLVVAGVMYFAGAPANVVVSVTPVPQGGVLSIGGELP